MSQILSEVRRVLEENGVLESRSPMAVLQSQFDAAIAQRDELMKEQADYDVEIHLMRELVMSMLCKMKGVDESSIIFPPEMDGSIESLKRCHDALVNDRFSNQVVFQKIKDEQIPQ